MAKFKLEEHLIKFHLRYIAFCKRTNFTLRQSTLRVIRLVRASISEIK